MCGNHAFTYRCIPSVNVKSTNEEHDMTNTKYQIISNSYFADHAVNLDLPRSTKKLSSPIISSSMPVFDFKSYWRSLILLQQIQITTIKKMNFKSKPPFGEVEFGIWLKHNRK